MQPVKSAFNAKTLFGAIRGCLPDGPREFPLHEPEFSGHDWDYVKECLDTGWVSSSGKFVDQFEKRLAEITGVRYAFAVVNGTAALHLALQMAGVERGDEVLLPDLTFVATANAVSYCGAVPHFVDSQELTLGLDPAKLAAHLDRIAERRGNECWNRSTGRRIRAVIAMHTFGHPVDLDPLKDLCARYRLELIEDAAEALGSLYKGRPIGQAGRLTTLSFNGNKIVTTGGGGAILTNDESLARLGKHVSTTAKVAHPWAFIHDQVGYNYRLPNLNAALGVAQLERLPDFLARKRKLALRYREAFARLGGVRFFEEPPFAHSNYWLNVILLDREFAAGRDALIGHLNENGIKARPAWTLMHKLPMHADCPRADVSTAEDIEARLINIPSSAVLAS